MNNFFNLQWWEKEQNKRKEHLEKHEISQLNSRLQKLINSLENFVEKSNYSKFQNNRILNSTSIWDLKYINNFENLDVAVLQIQLITEIINNEDIENKNYYWNQLNILENILKNIDYSIYTNLKRGYYN